MIDLKLGNCMDIMRNYEDNYFELCIADPPYGLGFGEFNRTNKARNGERYKANKYKNALWDNGIPDDDYFKELQRVSENQIIWGGNYFPYLWKNGCKGFIFWHKGNPVPNFADGELAYTSFDKVARQFDYKYYGNLEGNTNASEKIHPTQKPIALYRWLLDNYAEKGQRILDTHGGSMSSAIAAHYFGCDMVVCEIDEDYYKAGCERFERETKQLAMF